MPPQVITAAKAASFAESEGKVRGRDVAPRILFASLLGDVLAVFLSLAFSSWLRFEILSAYGSRAATVSWTDYYTYVGFGTLLFLILLPHREIYDLHRILKFRQIVAPFLKTALTWLVVFMALSWLLRSNREISRLYVLIAFAVTSSAFLSWRFLLSKFVSGEAIAQRLRQRLLFVGWSGPARSLAHAIFSDNRHPYEIIGYIPSGEGAPGSRSVFVRKLGDYSRIGDIIKEHDIDMVIQADVNAANPETLALAELCEKEMIDFKVMPGCFQVLLSCLRLETVSGVPVLGVSDLPLDKPFNILVKQFVDWIGGIVGLMLSAPLIVLFGLLVYSESPGPIIYRQKRLGVRGRPFWIYKIRSMKMNAETGGKVGWTVKDDPRRLRVGGFMRRWNIDELPQFWNVLKGDMSLVGPRPERPELISIFKEQIAHYNARHNIKPGITGWAQVNGLRGDTDLTERVRYDLYYIENWSALLDLQIMAMTLVRQKNAA
jgi:exopolysaccharide biosynthesis polyprenyl glycosylphosphotransferase